MKQFGFDELPCGFIVGEVELMKVKKYNSSEEFVKDKNLHLATEDFGNYGFILQNPKRMTPIPAKGSLNFWDFDCN